MNLNHYRLVRSASKVFADASRIRWFVFRMLVQPAATRTQAVGDATRRPPPGRTFWVTWKRKDRTLDRNRTKILKLDVGMIPIMGPIGILGRLRPLFNIRRPPFRGCHQAAKIRA